MESLTRKIELKRQLNAVIEAADLELLEAIETAAAEHLAERDEAESGQWRVRVRAAMA